MLSNITRAELCSRNGATLFGRYRARLLNTSQLPVISSISWMMGKKIVVIDRLLESDSEVSLATHEERGNILIESEDQVQDCEEHCSLNSSEFGTSPLKYEFLTLSKLQIKDTPKILIDKHCYSSTLKQFALSSLKTSEARSLAGMFITNGVPFDTETLPDPAIWISCDISDYLHTCWLGICKTNDGITTYHVSPNTAYCVYDVIPKTVTTNQDQNRLSGFVELHVSWTFSNMNHCCNGILSEPVPSASVVAKISPGWLDLRLPHLGLIVELELVLTLGRALRTGKVTWPNVDFDQIHKDEELMKSALQSLLNQTSPFPRNKDLEDIPLDLPQDFTEELWLILRCCHSNQDLTEALRCVFDALKGGYKNTLILRNNRCTMARLLRDACSSDLLLPRLEGLTPIQIYLEMGLERLRRVCIDEFLNREYFGSAAEIDAVFDCCAGKEPQDQADALFLFYNSLLVVNTCKQYLRLDRHHINIIARQVLEQYSKLNISPTADDITEQMMEEMTFTLNSRLSFTDIFKPVHENRFPKIWKSEVTVETTNKEGWIARCMILCSRTTWLPFIKNPETNDVASARQNTDVGNNIVELDRAKKNKDQTVLQNSMSEKIFCSSDEEKLKLHTTLRHYEISIVTGSFITPLSRY
uniref:Protein zwilch n=1 Tax=Wuchereria bancrofti TaxID=6293 RepID=A0A1I8EDR8_WUCBA